ncbi:MAG: hypothetical protein VZQ26_04155 [Methanomethylophilus sp.]|nr:hypothetical protein [Methanomethylophilus sp.]
MAEDKKLDKETQKFYDENKEMIDRILSQSKAESEDSEKAYLEEMLRRAAFERRMRLEYEAEKARRKAFEDADKAYSDIRYGRDRTEEAYEEARDHFRDYGRAQGDYFFDLLFEEADRARSNIDRARRYARDRYEEERANRAETRERVRQRFNEEFDEFFGPFSDTGFQKHLVGAGLELWMALNALIRAGPFPDSVKDAFTEADRNKNAEFCVKNEQCDKKTSKRADEPQPIKITAKGKKE